MRNSTKELGFSLIPPRTSPQRFRRKATAASRRSRCSNAADPLSFRLAIAFLPQFIFPYADPGRQLISLSSAVYETGAVPPVSYTVVLISSTCSFLTFSARSMMVVR
ncbi:hypothetical protein Aduo_002163 [Ancylostoma duodenale]